MARLFETSRKTPMLRRWDAVFNVVEKLKNREIDASRASKGPDISGDFARSHRAMEVRNPLEKAGLRSSDNLEGSRSEVTYPDISRQMTEHYRNATGDKTVEFPMPLHWHIARNETTGEITGGGPGSVHGHDSKISFMGMADNLGLSKAEVKSLGIGASMQRIAVYKFKTTRSSSKDATLTKDQHGILFVKLDAKGRPVQLLSAVYGATGNDPDLPDGFKEVAQWNKFTVFQAIKDTLHRMYVLAKLEIKALRHQLKQRRTAYTPAPNS